MTDKLCFGGRDWRIELRSEWLKGRARKYFTPTYDKATEEDMRLAHRFAHWMILLENKRRSAEV